MHKIHAKIQNIKPSRDIRGAILLDVMGPNYSSEELLLPNNTPTQIAQFNDVELHRFYDITYTKYNHGVPIIREIKEPIEFIRCKYVGFIDAKKHDNCATNYVVINYKGELRYLKCDKFAQDFCHLPALASIYCTYSSHHLKFINHQIDE